VSKITARQRHQKETRNELETRTNADAVQRSADRVRSRVGRAGNRTIGLAQAHHQVAVVKRIGNVISCFVGHQAFRPAQVVKKRDHLVEVGRTAVIDDIDAAQIQTVFLRGGTNQRFVTQQRDARQTLAHAVGRGDDGARVISFGKYDVLRSGRGALADTFENVHV
jgi:hypothetical protein